MARLPTKQAGVSVRTGGNRGSSSANLPIGPISLPRERFIEQRSEQLSTPGLGAASLFADVIGNFANLKANERRAAVADQKNRDELDHAMWTEQTSHKIWMSNLQWRDSNKNNPDVDLPTAFMDFVEQRDTSFLDDAPSDRAKLSLQKKINSMNRGHFNDLITMQGVKQAMQTEFKFEQWREDIVNILGMESDPQILWDQQAVAKDGIQAALDAGRVTQKFAESWSDSIDHLSVELAGMLITQGNLNQASRILNQPGANISLNDRSVMLNRISRKQESENKTEMAALNRAKKNDIESRRLGNGRTSFDVNGIYADMVKPEEKLETEQKQELADIEFKSFDSLKGANNAQLSRAVGTYDPTIDVRDYGVPSENIEFSQNREESFREWFSLASELSGVNPDPDHESHKYDYRALFDNNGNISKVEDLPPEFMTRGNPNIMKDGVNQVSGLSEDKVPLLEVQGRLHSELRNKVTTRNALMESDPDQLAMGDSGVADLDAKLKIAEGTEMYDVLLKQRSDASMDFQKSIGVLKKFRTPVGVGQQKFLAGIINNAEWDQVEATLDGMADTYGEDFGAIFAAIRRLPEGEGIQPYMAIVAKHNGKAWVPGFIQGMKIKDSDLAVTEDTKETVSDLVSKHEKLNAFTAMVQSNGSSNAAFTESIRQAVEKFTLVKLHGGSTDKEKDIVNNVVEAFIGESYAFAETNDSVYAIPRDGENSVGESYRRPDKEIRDIEWALNRTLGKGLSFGSQGVFGSGSGSDFFDGFLDIGSIDTSGFRSDGSIIDVIATKDRVAMISRLVKRHGVWVTDPDEQGVTLHMPSRRGSLGHLAPVTNKNGVDIQWKFSDIHGEVLQMRSKRDRQERESMAHSTGGF